MIDILLSSFRLGYQKLFSPSRFSYSWYKRLLIWLPADHLFTSLESEFESAIDHDDMEHFQNCDLSLPMAMCQLPTTIKNDIVVLPNALFPVIEIRDRRDCLF